jgi:hypothetical protein
MLSRLAAALAEKKRSIAVTKSAVSQHAAVQRDSASLCFFADQGKATKFFVVQTRNCFTCLKSLNGWPVIPCGKWLSHY